MWDLFENKLINLYVNRWDFMMYHVSCIICWSRTHLTQWGLGFGLQADKIYPSSSSEEKGFFFPHAIQKKMSSFNCRLPVLLPWFLQTCYSASLSSSVLLSFLLYNFITVVRTALYTTPLYFCECCPSVPCIVLGIVEKGGMGGDDALLKLNEIAVRNP